MGHIAEKQAAGLRGRDSQGTPRIVALITEETSQAVLNDPQQKTTFRTYHPVKVQPYNTLPNGQYMLRAVLS